MERRVTWPPPPGAGTQRPKRRVAEEPVAQGAVGGDRPAAQRRSLSPLPREATLQKPGDSSIGRTALIKFTGITEEEII